MPDPDTLRVASLPQDRPTAFDLRPDRDRLDALARQLDLTGLRKVRLSGDLRPQGATDWLLQATLGATVVQPCVITLDPVTTRLDVPVERLYVAGGAPVPGADEMEMPEDDRQEPLPEAIDLSSVLAEALALNLPQYPRADDARLGEAVYAEPGLSPLRDEDTRPFAALAGLRRSDDPDA